MDRTSIEKFATSARRQLMEDVKQRLFELGLSRSNVTKGDIPRDDAVGLDNKMLTPTQANQRQKLIAQIESDGYDRVVEQAAYTWFNRFTALRFMEVNGYLPSGVRVLSAAGEDPKDTLARPDVLRHATTVPLPVNRERVLELRYAGDDEALYRYLLIAQCDELAEALPFLFDHVNPWVELLFPRNALAEGSVIRRIVAEIPEEDWRDQVEIVGWLYQYYVSERKDQVYKGFKKGKKASKNDIPPATQLFTPNWIVRYMVDNSLGRLWLESRPHSKLREKMDYYIDEAEQDPKVMAELDKITRKNIDPAKITFIDPACGSGHILVYAFDLLYEMYLEAGYPETSIPSMILEKNLYGLDIDERAVQLASFALLMRARSKDPQILSKGILPNVIAIEESNNISHEMIDLLVSPEANHHEQKKQRHELECLLQVFEDATEYGSLIRVPEMDLEWLTEATAWAMERASSDRADDTATLDGPTTEQQAKAISRLARQARIMSARYDVVVTNPPYMYRGNMNQALKNYLRSEYKSSASDLFAAFMDQCVHLTTPCGFTAMITQHSWMFLSSLEDLREIIVENNTIYSMLHLGARTFKSLGGEVVQSASFVVRNVNIPSYYGTYVRLVEFDTPEDKIGSLHDEANRFVFSTDEAVRIPGSPVAYWASPPTIRAFGEGIRLHEIATPREGLTTADNARFLRLWHETQIDHIGFGMRSREEATQSLCRWFPVTKGGPYRKWYGNNDYVIDWERDGQRIRSFDRATIRNSSYYFLQGITWTAVSSTYFAARWMPPGFVIEHAGRAIYPHGKGGLFLVAFLCSKTASHFLRILNPTLNFQVGNVASLPLLFPSSPDVRSRIESLAAECINISKRDWDSFETSWDFVRHPFLVYGAGANTIEEAYVRWEKFADGEFERMRANEEEINRHFIDIYGLGDEMTPEVSDDDITISRADRDRDVRSFISYAVGCMFGRYSLDMDGLAYAGGEFEWDKYETFIPDTDNIIPVLDDAYFPNDIVRRFTEFVGACFGKKHLDENLDWIAETLGKRSGETAADTIRRYFINDFYRDHTQMYKKRPIYWMFSSGKQKGFNALIYMHRYQRDTVARLRTKYLLELESRLQAAARSLRDPETSSAPRGRTLRELEKLERQLAEIKEYDEKVHHLADRMIEIDLDDGVVVNYAKFEDVLEAIR